MIETAVKKLRKLSLKDEVEYLVNKYGDDSLSYLNLELDGNKEVFFSNEVEGGIVYCVYKNVVVCLGNPLCEKENLEVIIKEFKKYCNKNKLKISYTSVSKEVSDHLKNNDFVIAEYGQEAILNVNSFCVSGGKRMKLRQKIKRATDLGLDILEYSPIAKKDHELEIGILKLSEEWFSNKDEKMKFTVGSLNLERPLGRRYFVGVDTEKNTHCVLTFLPYKQGKGYFLDVMIRSKDSFPGAIEKGIVEALNIFRQEKVEEISLGVAPLSGIDIDKEKVTFLEKSMKFMFENIKFNYGFKTLYEFKNKFNPDIWNKRFIAYDKKISVFKLGITLVKVKGIDNIFSKIAGGIFGIARK